jgi:hypothetical protein
VTEAGAFAAADLKNAYDYGWCTPMHFSWTLPERIAGQWKLQPDTSPELVAYYKGTQHVKTRLWGDHYFVNNWGPAMRIEGNPVRYAFRTAGMVGGKHPYAVVCDNLDKDGGAHTYEWLMQLPEGLRLAGLYPPKDSAPAIILTRAPSTGAWGRDSSDRVLPKGTPALLVSVLQPPPQAPTGILTNMVNSDKLPLRVEQFASGEQAGAKPTNTRLVITRRAVDPAFKVVLIPFRIGEPVPAVRWNNDKNTGSIEWNDLVDELTFTATSNHRPQFSLQRNKAPVLTTP